jgi:hypothetical protein
MRVALTAVALLLLGTASLAFAVPTPTNVFDMQGAIAEKNANLSGNQPVEPVSEGGENIGTAILIGGLPYADGGFTCDNIDEYDEVCPFTGSTSADVVYSYSPAVNQAIDIDLCASQFDTKVYVYANAAGNLVACNDDAGCGITGFQSRLANINLTTGNTYYIVVDGYFGDCGDYSLSINVHQGCAATCPPGSQLEGEPPCGPNYVDSFNGGCNSTPNVFSPVNCSSICGKAGTYLFNGSNYRDTDWYRLTVGAGVFTYSGISDGFTLRLFTLTGVCPTTVIGTTATPDCVPSTPLNFNGPGTFFLFAGTDLFDGVPCESNYYLSITGPGIPPCATSTENTSWGAVKGLYQ